MIAGLLGNSKAFAEDFNCATHESRTWREVAGIYESEIGLKVKPCTIKQYIEIIGSPYQPLYDRMFDRVLDNAKVLSATGISNSSLKSLQKGLGEELAAFRASPRYRGVDARRQAMIDRLTGTRFPLELLTLRQKVGYWESYYPGLAESFPYKFAKKLVRLFR